MDRGIDTRSAFYGLLLGAALSIDSVQAVSMGFFKYSPINYFTDEDNAIALEHVRDALNNRDNGEVVRWQNDATGAEGEYTLLKTYQHDGATCRQVKVTHAVKKLRQTGTYTLCQNAEGKWQLAPG